MLASPCRPGRRQCGDVGLRARRAGRCAPAGPAAMPGVPEEVSLDVPTAALVPDGLDPAGRLRGLARRGGAVPPRRPCPGPGPVGRARGGSAAPGAGPFRQRGGRQGRLPAGARPAARGRGGARHDQHPTGAAHAAQDPGRHRRRGPVAGPRHRLEHRDLLAVQPARAAPAAGGRPRRAGQPRVPRTQAGTLRPRQRGRVRRDVQLPDVPRPGARTGGLHEHRRPQGAPRQRGPSGPRRHGAGHAGLGVVLRDPGPAAGGRPAVRSRDRRGRRRPSRRRPEPRLLAGRVRRIARRAGRRARRERRP